MSGIRQEEQANRLEATVRQQLNSISHRRPFPFGACHTDCFGPDYNMASAHPYRKPQRKETTLPPYEPPSPTNPMSFYTPVPTSSAIAHVEPRRFNSPRVGVGTPERRRTILMDYVFAPVRNLSGDLATLSGDSMRRVVSTIMEGYSNAGISMLGGPMHAPPETIASPVSPSAPAPPSYSASVKPMLLWLGTCMIRAHRCQKVIYLLTNCFV
jgi:hypothetical protein